MITNHLISDSMNNIDIAFLSESPDMLAALRKSKEHGTVVGISAPILGNGLFLTSVLDIVPAGDDHLITLTGYDVTGYILERNKLRLSEIRGICPFMSAFTNPYLKELTGERFFEIR
ncbi:MAG TPA: hypothetical protein VEB86_01220 [Chryseosolibacter sp.]|nr:hypothetical protein [Chryseosolibacter sp.]